MALVNASQWRALGCVAKVRDHPVVTVKVPDIAESADMSRNPSRVDGTLHMLDSNTPCSRALYTDVKCHEEVRVKALIAKQSLGWAVQWTTSWVTCPLARGEKSVTPNKPKDTHVHTHVRAHLQKTRVLQDCVADDTGHIHWPST